MSQNKRVTVKSFSSSCATSKLGDETIFYLQVCNHEPANQLVQLTLDFYPHTNASHPDRHHAFYSVHIGLEASSQTLVEVSYDWREGIQFRRHAKLIQLADKWIGSPVTNEEYCVYAVLRDDNRKVIDKAFIVQCLSQDEKINLMDPQFDERETILFVNPSIPTPKQDSGSDRLVKMMQLFKQLGYNVLLFPYDLVDLPKERTRLESMGIHVVMGADLNDMNASTRTLELFLEKYVDFLDFVFLSRPETASKVLPLLQKIPKTFKTIYDTVDLHFLRELRHASFEKEEEFLTLSKELKELEAEICRDVDTVIAITEEEKRVIELEFSPSEVSVIPNIHEPQASASSYYERKHLFFIGGAAHSPNVDAIRYFIKEIFPLIRREMSDVKLIVVGSGMTSDLLDIHVPGVELKGFVDNLDPLLNSAKVCIAPLRYGAGMKGKVGLSMSHGLPVVCSDVASEGMFLEHGVTALIANSPRSFSREIVRLYESKSLWNCLSENGLKHIQRYFSFDVVKPRLRALVETECSKI